VKKMSERNGIEVALEAGKKIGALKVERINGHHVVLIPEGVELEALPEFNQPPMPININAKITTDTAESFIEYFNRFSSESISAVFCDTDTAQFHGYIDYHGTDGSPVRCEHIVSHTCKPSEEWKEWCEADGKNMGQVEFALFLEQNMDEIVSPPAAQMLEMVLTLKAKTGIAFESGQRLQDGQVQFQYRETIEGSAGVKGDMKIPEELDLGMRVFEDGEAYAIKARFRYRIREGQVKMWIDLVRPQKTYRSAVNDVFKTIKEKVNALMVIKGSAN